MDGPPRELFACQAWHELRRVTAEPGAHYSRQTWQRGGRAHNPTSPIKPLVGRERAGKEAAADHNVGVHELTVERRTRQGVMNVSLQRVGDEL